MIQKANMDKEYWTYALNYAFYFGAKECQPSVNNVSSNQDHHTVLVGDEVSFNAKKEPSQTVPKLPSSIQEASKHPQWKEAMKAEFDSLRGNQVWTLEELPKGTKPLTGKGHFVKKHNEDANFKKCNTRFAAKGFR